MSLDKVGLLHAVGPWGWYPKSECLLLPFRIPSPALQSTFIQGEAGEPFELQPENLAVLPLPGVRRRAHLPASWEQVIMS